MVVVEVKKISGGGYGCDSGGGGGKRGPVWD